VRTEGKVEFLRNIRSEGGGIVFQQGLVMDLHTTGNKYAYVLHADQKHPMTYRVPKDAVRVVEGGLGHA
jgi:hypothetical protein